MERQENNLKLKIGDKAPYFSLLCTNGKYYSVTDFKNAKALVVIFTCNHCPYAQAYEGRLMELANKFQPLGAKFVAICANDERSYPEDSYENMVKKTKSLELPYPYLHDPQQIAALAYDAACTPETYVFDAEQKLQYHGRVDDNYKEEHAVQSKDLENAIAAVIAGTAPITPLTQCIGCSIKWKN